MIAETHYAPIVRVTFDIVVKREATTDGLELMETLKQADSSKYVGLVAGAFDGELPDGCSWQVVDYVAELDPHELDVAHYD